MVISMEYSGFPSSQEVEQELGREKFKIRYKKTLRSTVFALITAAAAAVLVATLWLPVLRIYGASMEPTLEQGQIVISLKESSLEAGDIVAFYYGNKVLLKRVIAGPGSWVEILEDGSVIVDGVQLEEPYLQEKSYGISDLEYPYQVPEGSYFLMGDNRETSVDSRHSTVGCIAEDQIVGKVVFRVWPLEVFGPVS